MNLKLVVASMSVLSLISCPVFAAAHAKHKHHHYKHKRPHHHVARHDYKDYKDMGSLPIQPATVEAACTISQSSIVINEMNQNVGRSLPNPCNPGWFNRVQFSGGINVDVGKWGNRNSNLMGENYQRLSLNDAYLNVAATVSDWAKAFASISYNTATINDPANALQATQGLNQAEYSSAYSNNIISGSSSSLQLEQAYATLGNFDVSPIFVQVGKQFQDFSRYEIHPITRSLTQVMSETLATSAKIGFIVPMGFHGAVYVFDDPLNKVGERSKATNYGVSLGFDQPSDQLGYGLGIGYLYNLIGVNDVAYNVGQFNNAHYQSRVNGIALYGDVNSGPFSFGARYTTTLQRFNANDLPKNGVAGINSGNGAKPWSAGIQAGYGFDAYGKNQNVYLGYQASRESAGLNLPKSRWLVGYAFEACKNTSLGVELDHDVAYGKTRGGTGNNTNLISLRSSVKFG